MMATLRFTATACIEKTLNIPDDVVAGGEEAIKVWFLSSDLFSEAAGDVDYEKDIDALEYFDGLQGQLLVDDLSIDVEG